MAGWALNSRARIADAFSAYAVGALWTLSTVGDTLTVAAHFVSVAGDVVTEVGQAFAIHTAFVQGAAHVRAAVDALTISAKLAVLALDVSAWVVNTVGRDAHLTVVTPGSAAVDRATDTIRADLVSGALHALTGVKAHAVSAGLTALTVNHQTGIETDPFKADQGLWTLIRDARAATLALDAPLSAGALCVFVDGTIAVVILSIAPV